MVEPSTVNLGSAVKAGNARLGEQSSQQGADETADTVRGKDIELRDYISTGSLLPLCKKTYSLIDMDQVLDLGGKVGSDGGHEANGNSRRGTDVACSRGDTNETCDGTGAESNGTPLPLEPPVKQHPGETADGSCEVGNDAGHDCAEVGRKRRTTVEAEPSEPEEDRAKDDIGSVVGLVRNRLGSVPVTLAEVESNRERGCTTADVDRSATSEVEFTEHERPSVRVLNYQHESTRGHPNAPKSSRR